MAEIMKTDATATKVAHLYHYNIPITFDSVMDTAFSNVELAES
jgi:hypothetical protein